jgi:delta 1-pyrroline-5-carboxylate dehydrogenase
VKINLVGAIKGCNIFGGKKLANTCVFVGGRIIVQQKNLENRNPVSESEELQTLGCTKILP